MGIEHVGLNVKNPAAMADWYVAHLGMRLVLAKDKPVPVRFLSDSDDDVMIEIYNNPAAQVPDYSEVDPLVLHLAFQSKDVRADYRRLLSAGAKSVTEPTLTPSGDELAIVRDPWGLPIQLARRHQPMI